MSSDARPQPAPRARAVPGAPLDALLARSDELARRWAIALILGLPLERIGELPLETFAREAPVLCTQVVRALRSDSELERIAAPGGDGSDSSARRLAEMTGARDSKAAVAAVEALRGVLWEALLDELRWASFDQSQARQVADLADRLAYVCSRALVSSLAEPASAPQRAQAPVALAAPEPVPAAREPLIAASSRSPLGNGVVIIDEAEAPAAGPPPPGERAPVNSAPERRAPAPTPHRAAGPGQRRTRARALPWDTPLRAAPSDPRDERA